MSETSTFRCLLRVRYAEVDAQNVVFNARYADYVDVAVTEFVRALGFAEDFVEGRLDYQLVKQSITWQAPAAFDAVLALGVSVDHVGTTSFRLRTDITRLPDGQALAEVETVYVIVDHHTLSKQAIPPAFRSALDQAARGLEVDLAGWRQGVQPQPPD
ncbi:acyl-CoA thioesterase [Algiphilus sp.]|uniref:acyl-CoA thioesterase n=1 Tax=Algiphilus sp. TaxID=1872431 RepID=UPI003BAA6ED2